MISESDRKPDPARAVQPRRAFLSGMARRAAYVAPVVMAIHSTRTAEAGGLSCGTAGSPCDVNADCCAASPTCEFAGLACGGMMGCTCV